MVVGVKVAMAPAGSPEIESVTAAANPPDAVVVTVAEVEEPGVTDAAVGLTPTVKSGPVTRSVSGAVLVSPPPVPVTVSG